MRKNDLPLGTLAVYNPETLQLEGKVKLLCGDILAKPTAWGFNRYFPLMAHGNTIYVIMIGIKEVQREVKVDKKAEFDKLMLK